MRIILLFILLTACSRNPVTGKSELFLVSQTQEIELGMQAYPLLQQAQGGPYVAHPSVEAYVQRVGQKLANVSDRPQLPFNFIVLDNSVPNAWALPGGKIAIYRGLLVELQSEAELAAVLAHEIVHSAARHSAKQMERQLLMQSGLATLQQILAGHSYQDLILGSSAATAQLLSLKYSRHAELEADAYGIKYMVAAGYDPTAAVKLQEMFLRLHENAKPHWLEGLFSTHPPSQERIAANLETTSRYPIGGVVGQEEYEKAIQPLRKAKPAYEALDKGYVALSEKNISLALKYAQEAIALEPQEGHFYNLAGKAQAATKNFTEALTFFEKAATLNPHYYDFLLQVGLTEYELGRIEDSKKNLEASVLLLPTAEGHYTLGNIALKEGDKEAAERHFAIAADAESPLGEEAKLQLKKL